MTSVSLRISLMTVARASGLAPFSHSCTHKAKESGSSPVLRRRESSCKVLNVSLAAKMRDEAERLLLLLLLAVEVFLDLLEALFELEDDEEAIALVNNYNLPLHSLL